MNRAPHDWLLLLPALAVADRGSTGLVLAGAVLLVLACRGWLSRQAGTSPTAGLAVVIITAALLTGLDLSVAAWLPDGGVRAGAALAAFALLLDTGGGEHIARQGWRGALLLAALPVAAGAARELWATGTLGGTAAGPTSHPAVGLLLLALAALAAALLHRYRSRNGDRR